MAVLIYVNYSITTPFVSSNIIKNVPRLFYLLRLWGVFIEALRILYTQTTNKSRYERERESEKTKEIALGKWNTGKVLIKFYGRKWHKIVTLCTLSQCEACSAIEVAIFVQHILTNLLDFIWFLCVHVRSGHSNDKLTLPLHQARIKNLTQWWRNTETLSAPLIHLTTFLVARSDCW